MASAASFLGIQFPERTPGKRASLPVNINTWADSVRLCDPVLASRIQTSAKSWRHEYPKFVKRTVELGLASTDQILSMSQRGINSLHQQLRFEAAHEESLSFAEYQKTWGGHQLSTYSVKGQGSGHPDALIIPYKGQMLSGSELLKQIDDWEHRHIIEPSTAHALRLVEANPEWLHLENDYIAMLGAACEMGPLHCLLQWGANVLAIDLNRPKIWSRLITDALNSNGTLIFPTRQPMKDGQHIDQIAENAGADLLLDTAEIAGWLDEQADEMTIGAYAYLDGEKHVRVAAAMDAIQAHLTKGRQDRSLAFLPTPTDVFVVPEGAALEAQQHYQAWKKGNPDTDEHVFWQHAVRWMSRDRYFQPNIPHLVETADGMKYGIVDCMVSQQGPNYSLAKRLQLWRAMQARSEGVKVSSNVAPATATWSVVKNKAMAAAYAGTDKIGMEIFEPDTSNALLAALLVYDLKCRTSRANPEVPLHHPYELFMEGAVHNGFWRHAFSSRSALEVAAVLGWHKSGAMFKHIQPPS